ncbi:uncharacterized protein LOC125549217 isoform X2 [Triticum urartu]|uniref:uncharacterized protein LOC125549217 isoform X2 n=1 Tax=Triticum urartu TaxID=4572 RepID=UPI002044842B|nr:uncharacterized protein LOC125549217 isoform X2 [Triticum urartu]
MACTPCSASPATAPTQSCAAPRGSSPWSVPPLLLNGTRTNAAPAAWRRRPPKPGSTRSRQHRQFCRTPTSVSSTTLVPTTADGDDEGAGDILGDILEAMNHTPPHEDGEGESSEDLHKQFEELFLKPDAAYSSSSSSSSKTRAAGRK